MPDQAQPSPALLIYFFADRFPLQGVDMGGWIQVPCSEARVREQQLAPALYAASLWNLRESGLVALDAFSHKRRFRFDVSGVRATLLGEAPAEHVRLEDYILARMALGPEESVERMVHRTKVHQFHPFTHVVGLVLEEAEATGWARDVAVDFRVSGIKLRITPDCERIQGERGGFDELVARWERFRDGERELHDLLLTNVTHGLRNRILEPNP